MPDDLRSTDSTIARNTDSGSQAVTAASSESDVPGAGVVSAIDPRDPFTSRATVLTSNILTVMAYSLNWYARAHGQPEYLPDWVLGFIWAPWGLNAWTWLKARAAKK